MASRKPLWIVGGVIAGIIAIVVVVVVVIFASIDSIIKAAVENVGPKMTQSEVKLDKVELSTTSGEGRLVGLSVGNPKGFSTPTAMKLGEIAIKLDVSTITSDTIVIKDLLIRAPEITYEYGSAGGNIEAIKKNVDSYVGQSASTANTKAGTSQPVPAADKKASTEEGGKKLIIENLRLQDGKVIAAVAGQQMSQGLPAIQLKDIGKAKGGATPAEVVEQLLAAIQQNVARAVQSMGADQLRGAAKGALDSATQGLPSSGGATGGDAAKSLQEGVKGLFGK
jgi:uncharacterized protein involved in outer membrane biogenesis